MGGDGDVLRGPSAPYGLSDVCRQGVADWLRPDGVGMQDDRRPAPLRRRGCAGRNRARIGCVIHPFQGELSDRLITIFRHRRNLGKINALREVLLDVAKGGGLFSERTAG